MINCVPSLPTCAPWRAKAYGPKVSQLPRDTAKKMEPVHLQFNEAITSALLSLY